MSDPAWLRLDPLHPQNPRLVLGEEVVDGLAAQRERTQVFPAEQAMLARPVNDNYQSIAGWYR